MNWRDFLKQVVAFLKGQKGKTMNDHEVIGEYVYEVAMRYRKVRDANTTRKSKAELVDAVYGTVLANLLEVVTEKSTSNIRETLSHHRDEWQGALSMLEGGAV